MKIALGSVQFGCDYGISNEAGQVNRTELATILAYASNVGISLIDTAPAYGNSEIELGSSCFKHNFSFVSKISPDCPIENIVSSSETSIRSLKIHKLDALLLHHGEQLLSDKGDLIYEQLLKVKNHNRLTKKIGCSVYSPKEALTIVERYNVDIVQIPASIFDQRVFQDDILAKLKEKDIEVHVRSLFLQGALFLPPNKLPLHLEKLKPVLKKLNTALIENKTDILTLAIAPFVQNKNIDKIVLGCCSLKQLKEIITAYKNAKTLSFAYRDHAIFDENIINPSLWPSN
ncbi:MAG: aryl-alcohol dehydrogenase-like predicted oxidoreductase [Alteromonadaceae bacterium]|jgi:aryl-alcohol dehydrogenase-like predicted oxidoreductase